MPTSRLTPRTRRQLAVLLSTSVCACGRLRWLLSASDRTHADTSEHIRVFLLFNFSVSPLFSCWFSAVD